MLGVIFSAIAIALGVGALGYFIGWKYGKKPILENNEQILQEREEIQGQVSDLENDLRDLNQQQTMLKIDVQNLQNNKVDLHSDCENLAAQSAQQQSILDKQREEVEYQKSKANEEYQLFLDNIEEQKGIERRELLSLSQQHQAILDKILEKIKKDYEIDFYSLQLKEDEIEDINYLNSMRKGLNYPTAIGKIIWTMFVQKKTKALAQRVLGNDVVCGIYRLWNRQNDFCYVGQAVDCKKRLTEHMKAGCGATEVSNKNKLYAAMKNDGIENFCYELLEECDREDLDKKEKYYINYYRSDVVGYNSTVGNGE